MRKRIEDENERLARRREVKRKYYQRNREKINAYYKEYYEKNKEAIQAKRKAKRDADLRVKQQREVWARLLEEQKKKKGGS